MKNRSTLDTVYCPIRRDRVLEELLDSSGVPLKDLPYAFRGYMGLAACLPCLRFMETDRENQYCKASIVFA